MPAARPTLADALGPVRDALIKAARADVARADAEAVEGAQRDLAAADAIADRLRVDARVQGAADAGAVLSELRARAGRQARAVVLAARNEEYEALAAAARTAVTALRDDPAYPAIHTQLADLVRDRLGVDAEVRDAPGGGVIGIAGGRRLDCSLRGFADRAVDTVAAELDAP